MSDRDGRGHDTDLTGEIRAAAAYRPDPARPAVPLRLPFSGPWLTVRTPAHRVPSHGTHLGGQTFALDFVALDARRPGGRPRRTASVTDWRTWVATEPVDRFVGFGAPVLAPAPGRVVAVHDGEVDHEARRSPLTQLPYLATQGSRLRRGIGAVTGNHVILELDDQTAYVLLAHLGRASISLSVGAHVDVGDQVATCGNSGNSTQPHLHVQVMDSPALPRARGLAVVFEDYDVWPRTGSAPARVGRGLPGRGEVVHADRPRAE